MTSKTPITPDVITIPRKVDGDILPNIIGLQKDALANALNEIGIPAKQIKMRTAQIWQWLYVKGAQTFDEMTNLSKDFRTLLLKSFSMTRPEMVTRQIANDGTRKYLLRVTGGHEVETVFIPEKDRGTLCISSQIGCTLTCTFCHTGTQKLVRNLTPAEIVGQILIARDDLEEWNKGAGEKRNVSNIVLMGMGEPLCNYENVAEAMRIIMSGEGVAVSKRRITLSTSGVVPEIKRAGEELGVNLAISLHATRDELRDELVPINRKYKLAELIEACRNYPGLSNARRITWEYVMLDGVNDSDEDCRELLALIKGIPSKLNLIPFNPWPGSPYVCSKGDRIDAFAKRVLKAGYASPVRTPRGRDILAACGQLKSASQRIPRQKKPKPTESASA